MNNRIADKMGLGNYYEQSQAYNDVLACCGFGKDEG